MGVTIRVYENGRHMDEEAAYTLGDDFSPDAALEECGAMVLADLAEVYAPGMSAGALVRAYQMFGRDPVILGKDAPGFSAWTYAEESAAEIAEAR